MKVQTLFIPYTDITAGPPFLEVPAFITHTYIDPISETHYKGKVFYPGQVSVFNRTDGLIGINSMEGEGDRQEFDTLQGQVNYYDFIPVQPGGYALETNSFNMTHLRFKTFDTLTKGDIVVSFYNYRT